MDLDELIKDARNSSGHEMVELVEDVTDILDKERGKRNGEALFYLPKEGYATIIGDIHGDLESLSFILEHSKFLEEENSYLVTLGDYGDRGLHSAEVYYVILKIKEEFPDRVALLRGNHEFPVDLIVRPHDLPMRLEGKYGKVGREIYLNLRTLFDYLLNGAVVKGKYIFLHGGLPTEAESLKDIAFAHKTHPSKSHLEEILWNDPKDGIKGSYPSPRGAGRVFGPDITERILKRFGVKTLIRSHEPCEGTDVKHEGRILSLFSRKGRPYRNSKAAYLKIDLSEEPKDAYELDEKAHKF